MELRAGERVGLYEIRGPLGAGGMGEVYRALDSRLGRDVAIKVLPEAVSQDPDRMARFDREARLLAALNHPGIAAIYGVEDSPRGRLLILELVPGDTLAERIARGRVTMDEALSVAQQIAAAVSYAHASGVVHRDLKPANIKLTPDGKVKVLDFGLAKALSPASGVARADDATAVVGDTKAGMIVGSPGYMSPEQARGEEVDRRTDIWAFGCILFQLLSGRAPFPAQTIPDALAAILRGEPEWAALPAETPSAIRTLLRRCLQRDRDRRLHDMADARIEIEETLSGTALPEPRAIADVNRWQPADTAAVLALVLASAVNVIFLYRLVPSLASTYAGAGLELSAPLRFYIAVANNGLRVFPVLAAVLVAFWFFRRPRVAAAARSGVLGMLATIGCVWTMAGLYFVAENGLVHTMRLELASGASGQVLQRDLAGLYVATNEPQKAVDLIDPQRTLERTFTAAQWGSPGRAMQLADAYRALGDTEAARRWYLRAQEAATAFDEVVSERVQARSLRIQSQFGLGMETWMPATAQMRALPDLVKAVAQQRLNQLNAAPAR